MDTIPFGPALIGQTEKTLVALLQRCLTGTSLTEPQWVTLRIADTSSHGSTEELARTVADRTHFPDAAELVDELTHRGLLVDGCATDAGTALVRHVLARAEQLTTPIWTGLDVDDAEATTRTLNEVLERARRQLHA